MSSPEEQPKHTPEQGAEITKRPMIEGTANEMSNRAEKYIGEADISMVDVELEGDEKKLGVARDQDNNILLDQEAQRLAEIRRIDRFLSAVENGEDLGTFFRREKPQFIALLADYLTERRTQLEAGISPDDTQYIDTLSNADFGKAMLDKIKSAADIIKVQSQKELLRRGISSQIEYLPFESVKLLESGREVAFNRANLLDEGSPETDPGKLDWIFSQGDDGELELTISSRDGIAEINGRGDTPDDFIKSKKYVIIVEDSNDDELIIKIDRGGAPIDPLFTRIRFVRNPFSIEEELRKYNQKKAKATASKPSNSSNNYTPSAPAYQPAASESYRPSRNYTSSSG